MIMRNYEAKILAMAGIKGLHYFAIDEDFTMRRLAKLVAFYTGNLEEVVSSVINRYFDTSLTPTENFEAWTDLKHQCGWL